MLVNMKDMLREARRNKMAVAAINTPGFDIVRAAVDAAEELQTPVILDHASAHETDIAMEVIGPYMVECAKNASVPVAVNLDHGLSLNMCLRAVKCGFSSVMYDGSYLPYEENIANVKEICDMVHPLGLTVEAEIGRMPGFGNHGGIDPKDKTGFYTDPEVAKDFAVRTGCDALAVCIGTEHGFYKAAPVLDLKRLEDIRAAVPEDTALVMHGSSGVSFENLQAAISSGMSKINYYTYLSIQVAPELQKIIARNPEQTYYNTLTARAYEVLKQGAKDIITCMRNGR